MKLYNLFPRLCGPLDEWTPHLERAADLGFDWVFVNPIQKRGRSDSLYSITDYFAISRDFLRPGSRTPHKRQVRAMISEAEHLGMRVMIDLVINHCAIDSRLVRNHPEWFVREGQRVANAACIEADGTRVVWEDLAQFDWHHTSDREGLFGYCLEVVEHLIALGFRGFRCDAAYQVPAAVWHRLIEHVQRDHPEVVFVAETLGCSPEQTRETAAAGFDAIFNSGKWWDLASPWLLEQYDATRALVPSIGFPESHDTARLYAESGGNPHALEQRYLFAALFSGGVLMPIGYEFGFARRLDVVATRPTHWETPNLDLGDFIRHVNAIKDAHPVFQGEGPVRIIPLDNPAVLLLHKRAEDGAGEALIALNKDIEQRQWLHVDDLYRHLERPAPLRDCSFQWTMDYLPTPFDFELGPGMARVLVTGD
ncbi:alpha-amylase [Marichromatium gracile]|uniref:alpha-amylase family glycosyl hydrolase n=1 Tax=Marichromatium gracile TaxID=1048 RepID=UPI001F26A56B|nr:alpha-amylase family glycosyl hydrolase [Marichromatium gracile]MCF1183910.1 alpha-amylase [Marichromatium gracile]